MREKLFKELCECHDVTGMLLTFDKFYQLDMPIGSISRNIIINNLVSKYEKQLNGQKYQLIEELKVQPNLKLMFGVLDRYVDFTTPFPDNHTKVNSANSLMNNFDSIVTITRLKTR